uniref:Secreted protein n=1 Tax=Arundo donax TaxID=35708 RepID=A0A0A9DH76_ARUDO
MLELLIKQWAFLFALILFSNKWQRHWCCCQTSVNDSWWYACFSYLRTPKSETNSKDNRFLLRSATEKNLSIN